MKRIFKSDRFVRIWTAIKKITSNKWFLDGAIIVCVGVFLFSGAKILLWMNDNKQTEKVAEKVQGLVEVEPVEELIPEPEKAEDEVDTTQIKFLTTDITKLKKENPDTVGWLVVAGTNVNYPVVQSNDNSYYLDHDFYKKKNKAGWVFADFRCDFNNLNRNTIIYGHERIDYSMFGSLTFCRKPFWYNKKTNHYIFLNTATEKTVWQIFTIYVTTTDFNYINVSFGDTDYAEFIKTINGKNQISTLKADATENDKIITLSTCFNYTKRLVVTAKLIKSERTDGKTPPVTSEPPSSSSVSDTASATSSDNTVSTGTSSSDTVSKDSVSGNASSTDTASDDTSTAGTSSNPHDSSGTPDSSDSSAPQEQTVSSQAPPAPAESQEQSKEAEVSE